MLNSTKQSTPKMQVNAALGSTMIEKRKVLSQIEKIVEVYGDRPLDYFCMLVDGDHKVLSFDLQNSLSEELKLEAWHSLNLENYWMWALSDNGEYLFWDGQQVVILNSRSFKFLSVHMPPFNLIRNLIAGIRIDIFPEDLLDAKA